MSAQKLLAEIYSWSKALFFSLAIALFINMFFIQPFTVSGESMEPTFEGLDPYDEDQAGDRVLVFKGSYTLGNEPKFGDIVIIDSRIDKPRTLINEFLESPIVAILTGYNDKQKNNWIKRVIGEAGDKLEFENGKLYRNNELLNENYIKEDMDVDFDSIVVPENTVFVMGDNRNYSSDSRKIGPVPIENVIGKVVLRFYPFEKINKF
ncbi:signal peptidase I [bacterium LRH843]|nr:signal peptidase I [bacterium LRH843]